MNENTKNQFSGGSVFYLSCKYQMKTIVFGNWFYIAYNFANVFNAIWIVVWVNEQIWPAAICLLCIAVGLLIGTYIAHKCLFVDMNQAAF